MGFPAWMTLLGMGDTKGCHRALGLGDSTVVLVVHAYFYPIRKVVRVFVSVLSALAPGGKQVSVLNFKRCDANAGHLWLF